MEPEQRFTPLPRHLQFRIGLLVGLALMLAIGFVVYVLYARGVFHGTQPLTLVADNAEGVAIGDDLTFAGFPIGRVRRISLAEDGRARIEIDVPLKDSRWLRASSVFTLEKGLFGGASIRAHTGNLQDTPLPEGAVRPVLRGDTSEEIPRLVASLRSILDNLEQMTTAGGNLQASIANVRSVTERAAGRQGAVAALLGEEEAKKLVATLEHTNRLLASLNGLVGRADGLVGRADGLVAKAETRVFAPGGALEGTERAVAQVNAVLGDTRQMLQRADALLADAEQVSGNAKAATKDLAALRAEVDASVRKISGLIDEINRKWPFERKTEIRLP